MRKIISAALFGLTVLGVAHADDAPAPMSGVWTGTIGTYPVNVCLQVKSDDSYNFGAYYYLSHLKLISLQQGEKDNKGKWTEGTDADKPDAVWTLGMKDDTVTGSWAGNGKTLDVNLHRLAALTGDDADGPCASEAFFSPRLTPPTIKETAATLDGHAYTKVSVDAGKQFDVAYETFKLNGSGAAIDKLNAIFLPDGGKGYVECLQGAAGMGNDGSYDVHFTPEVYTEHYLVVQSGDGSFCGGAHPVNSSSDIVYDLRTGEALDLSTWLTPAAMKDNKIAGKLSKLVIAAYTKSRGDNQDCISAVKEADGWDASLTKTGMTFTPELPYAAQACADATEISFNDVAPFLNADGKKQVAAFRGELK